MSRLTKILIGIGAGLVIIACRLFTFYKVFIESDPEPRAEIEQTQVSEGGVLDGSYTVAPGDSNNFVGYRVQEVLVGGAIEQTATGRTSDATGTFTITGTTVEEVSITANLQTLTSDRSQRDDAIKDRGLESNQFPESTFVLTEPIELAEVPEVGATVTATAVGDFTLHGVTKRVEIPVEGRWDGRDVQVVGTIHILFSDYEIEAPTSPAVVSVQNEGEMEFQLFFRKS